MLGSKKLKENKLNVVETKMLCWMNGHTRQDRFRNECTIEKVGVPPIVEKIIDLV